jgi:hypothetical protein
MFGFRGGETADTVARKRGYLKDAQRRWGFLTYYDLSTIKNEAQLGSMVKERSSISEAQAKSDVQAWMQGKQF